ncbi:phage portal protein [Aeoliella sp.]|uniref:phage portal protein n=1 Tax=Aeoliella sp. TaxID=2795800 RepID=UPI003CCB9F5A
MVAIKRNIQLTNNSSDELINLFAGPRSETGEIVSPTTVSGIPALLQAVRIIADSCGRCTVKPYRVLDDGGRVEDENNPVHDLLSHKANPFRNSFSVIHNLVAQTIIHGKGFLYIDRDDVGTPIGLYNLPSADTYTITEYDNGRLTAIWYGLNSEDGKQYVFPAEDIIHINSVNFTTGVEGLSLIDNCKTVLGLSIAQTKYASILFKHGSHIHKVLKVPFWLSPEQAEETKATLAAWHTGVTNAHKLAVIQGGMDLVSMPESATDGMQLLESRNFSLIDLANVVGLPVCFLQGQGMTSYSSLEQMNLALLNLCLDAWLTQLEIEFCNKLIKPRMKKRCFIEFDRDSLFASDPSYKQMLITQFQAGAISWEELRQKINRTTDPGSMHFVSPANLTELFKEPEPTQPVDDQPTEEVVDDQEETVEEPVEETEDQTVERAKALTIATLDRLKARIIKSMAKDGILQKHFGVCRDALPGMATPLLDLLESIADEINSVLPEYRQQIIEEKWISQEIANQIWK